MTCGKLSNQATAVNIWLSWFRLRSYFLTVGIAMVEFNGPNHGEPKPRIGRNGKSRQDYHDDVSDGDGDDDDYYDHFY